MSARRPLALGAVLLASVAGLAACEKPLPEVTVVVGGTSVSAPAGQYCEGSQSIAAGNCRHGDLSTHLIRTHGATSIGVDVPPKVAQKGWYLVVNGQRANTDPLKRTFVRLPVDASGLQTGGLDLQIYQAAKDNRSFTGAWVFRIEVR
jgi:hypothetical protein